MSREVNVELLLNCRVRALNGRRVGLIEEVRATRRDGEWIVTDFLIGAYALFERFAVIRIGRSVLRVFRVTGKSYRVPWNKLDLSDPDHPRLTCPVSELEPL